MKNRRVWRNTAAKDPAPIAHTAGGHSWLSNRVVQDREKEIVCTKTAAFDRGFFFTVPRSRLAFASAKTIEMYEITLLGPRLSAALRGQPSCVACRVSWLILGSVLLPDPTNQAQRLTDHPSQAPGAGRFGGGASPGEAEA